MQLSHGFPLQVGRCKKRLNNGKLIRKRRGSHEADPVMLPMHYYGLLPTPGSLRSIKSAFRKQLEEGLETEVEPTGRHMLMLPTYVTSLT